MEIQLVLSMVALFTRQMCKQVGSRHHAKK